MTTLILDKTVNLLSDLIASLQLQLDSYAVAIISEDESSKAAMAENSYYDNEYNNSVENNYSRYGF